MLDALIPRLRWAIVPLTIALAAGAFVNALGNVLRIPSPEVALMVRPGDAVALTLRADQRLAEPGLAVKDVPELMGMARQALRTDPLTAPALRQLSAENTAAGAPADSDKLFTLAFTVTHRELGTLLLKINDRVAANDVHGALVYVDMALTANPAAADLLFPVIEDGLSDATLRDNVAVMLQRDRPWMPALLKYLVRDQQHTAAATAALIIRAGGHPRTSAYDGIDGAILTMLATHRQFATAKLYMATSAAARLAAPDLLKATAQTSDNALGPFAWKYSVTADYEASFAGDGRITGRIEAGRLGVVARRTVLLAPRDYRVDNFAQTAARGVSWQLACLTDPSVQIGWPKAPGAVLAIPATCGAQEITLTGEGDEFGAINFAVAPPTLRQSISTP